MDPVLALVFVVGLLVFMALGSVGLGILVDAWKTVRLEDHKTRRLEALAKMDDTARNRLLETMPDWLDREDPEDVEAWKEARSETLQLTDKGGEDPQAGK